MTDVTRKRLLYRARHMGTNENDIFFGSFAEEYLNVLTDAQCETFEKLMEVNDPDLFLWVTGARPVPPDYQTDVMDMLSRYTLAQARR